MKKTLFGTLCTLLSVLLLAGCGGSATSSAPPVDPIAQSNLYREIIEEARDPELNTIGIYAIATPEDSQPPDFDYSNYESLTDAQKRQLERYNMHKTIFEGNSGLVEADCAAYAISFSSMITFAYGVAVILPAPGKADAVAEQLNGFIAAKQQEFAPYLQDQYQIALAAKVTTAPTGEVILVMSRDSATEHTAIEMALAA